MSRPPIFVVGCPRSGTTLLRSLLNSHPQLVFPSESHFIPRLYRAYGNPEDPRAARRLARNILRMHWVRSWQLELDADRFSTCRSFSEIVSRLYEEVCRQAKKPRWGDKTPQYILDIPLLIELFPAAQVIQIIRDGRDVALSLVRAPFGPENVVAAAELWKRFVSKGRRAGSTLSPKQYYEIRYENLLIEPEKTLRGVCGFLDERFAPEVLRPSFRPRKKRKIIFESRDNLPVSTSHIVPTNLGKWQTELPPAQRGMIELVAGDLLTDLGYEIDGTGSAVSEIELCYWKAHNHFWHCLQRAKRVCSPEHFETEIRLKWAEIRAAARQLVSTGRTNDGLKPKGPGRNGSEQKRAA